MYYTFLKKFLAPVQRFRTTIISYNYRKNKEFRILAWKTIFLNVHKKDKAEQKASFICEEILFSFFLEQFFLCWSSLCFSSPGRFLYRSRPYFWNFLSFSSFTIHEHIVAFNFLFFWEILKSYRILSLKHFFVFLIILSHHFSIERNLCKKLTEKNLFANFYQFLCTLKNFCNINILKILSNMCFCSLQNLQNNDIHKPLNLNIFINYLKSVEKHLKTTWNTLKIIIWEIRCLFFKKL